MLKVTRQSYWSRQCNTIFNKIKISFWSDSEDNNCWVVCVGRNALEKISKASKVELKVDRNHL